MQTLTQTLTTTISQASVSLLKNALGGDGLSVSIDSLIITPNQASNLTSFNSQWYQPQVRLSGQVSVLVHFDRNTPKVDKLIFSLALKPLAITFLGDDEVVYSGLLTLNDIRHQPSGQGSQLLHLSLSVNLSGLVPIEAPTPVKEVITNAG